MNSHKFILIFISLRAPRKIKLVLSFKKCKEKALLDIFTRYIHTAAETYLVIVLVISRAA